ncbi:MAG: diguanylate cyclase [Anaerolineaceae bacterium]|nr:diguanylate cyclase [Anaerolineaceae bacterium]
MINGRIIIIAILISASLITLYLFISSLRRRDTRAAVYFAICMLGGAIYNFGYAMELSKNTLAEIMLWVRFEHLGMWFMVTTWFLFSMSMTGKDRLITPGLLIGLTILTFGFTIAGQTLGGANLFHPNPHLYLEGPFPIFAYDRGIVGWLGVVYSILCLAISTILFVLMFLRSAPTFRSHAALLAFGSLFPWIGLTLFAFGLSPYNMDLNPIGMSFSGVVFSIGFIRFRLFDIVPLARDVIFEGIEDGVLVLDTQDRIVDLNLGLQKILPYVDRSFVGRSVFEALEAFPVILSLIQDDSFKAVELQVEDSGINKYFRANLMPLNDLRHKHVGKLIRLHDYTQTKVLLGQLEEFAIKDGLTGIYNRRHFNKLTEEEFSRLDRYGGSLSLIIYDIDNFKLVNDTYGHAAGDLVLIKVIERCQEILRKSDIIGRYGGEEFIILLPSTESPTAIHAAQRLCEEIELLGVQYEGKKISVTASFGVASVSKSSQRGLEDIVRRADQALYAAKSSGCNRVCVSDQPDQIPQGK